MAVAVVAAIFRATSATSGRGHRSHRSDAAIDPRLASRPPLPARQPRRPATRFAGYAHLQATERKTLVEAEVADLTSPRSRVQTLALQGPRWGETRRDPHDRSEDRR